MTVAMSAPTLSLAYTPTGPVVTVNWITPMSGGNPTGQDYNLARLPSTTARTEANWLTANIYNPHIATTGYVTSFDDTTVSTGTWYYAIRWKDNALNWSLYSVASAAVSVVVPMNPPTVNQISTTAIKLDWVAPTGVTSYHIIRQTNPSVPAIGSAPTYIPTGTPITYTDSTGLVPGVTYYYFTKWFGATTVSTYSQPSVGVTFSNTPPVAPTNLTLTPNSALSVSLNWLASGSADAANYRIFKSTDGGSTFSILPAVINVPTTTYTDTTTYGSQNYYYVRTINNFGISSTDASPTRLFKAPPAIPLNLTASVSSGVVTVSWTPSTGSESYEVSRSLSGGPWTVVGTPVSSPLTESPPSGTGYQYRIQAYISPNPVGLSGYSGYSSSTAPINVIATLLAPSTPSLSSGAGRTVNISWTVTAGAVTYSLYRGLGAATPTLVSSGIVTTSTTDTPLVDGTYTYKLTATNASGTSAQSTGASILIDTVAPPTVPVWISGAQNNPASRAIDLSWASDSAVSYKLYVAGSLVASPVTPSATYTPGSDGTYNFTVAGVNASGVTSSSSSGLSVSVALIAGPPAVSGVTVLTQYTGHESAVWSFVLAEPGGGGQELLELGPASSKSYRKDLLEGGTASFTLDSADSESRAIEIGAHDVKIYRNHLLMDRLRIVSSTRDGGDDSTISYSAVGYKQLLRRSKVQATDPVATVGFTNMDLEQAGWSLIDLAQTRYGLASESKLNIQRLGVATGRVMTGITLINTGNSVTEIIDGLSQSISAQATPDGWDWDILASDNDLYFGAWPIQRGKIEGDYYFDNRTTVVDFSEAYDLSTYANVVVVQGAVGYTEMQRITTGSATGGFFTLTFNGQTTVPMTWNASKETIQLNLEALLSIGAGNVWVTSDAQDMSGGPMHVQFVKELQFLPMPLIIMNPNPGGGFGGLTGGSGSIASTHSSVGSRLTATRYAADYQGNPRGAVEFYQYDDSLTDPASIYSRANFLIQTMGNLTPTITFTVDDYSGPDAFDIGDTVIVDLRDVGYEYYSDSLRVSSIDFSIGDDGSESLSVSVEQPQPIDRTSTNLALRVANNARSLALLATELMRINKVYEKKYRAFLTGGNKKYDPGEKKKLEAWRAGQEANARKRFPTTREWAGG